MSKISDEITKKIQNMNSTDYQRHIKNRPQLSPKLLRYKRMSKIKKILDFLDIGTGSIGSSINQSPSQVNVSQSVPDFRDRYRVDENRPRTIEDYVIEKRAAEAYLREIDGKGDEPPHGGGHHGGHGEK